MQAFESLGVTHSHGNLIRVGPLRFLRPLSSGNVALRVRDHGGGCLRVALRGSRQGPPLQVPFGGLLRAHCLRTAAATLDKNTAACRRALYERARTSLVTQMRKFDPPLCDSEIRHEQFALEEAIRRFEAEKLSRLAQRDDQLTGKLNDLVQKMHQMRQQMSLRALLD